MICEKCGKEFDSNYCPECGAAYQENEKTSQAVQPSLGQSSVQYGKIIAAICLAICAMLSASVNLQLDNSFVNSRTFGYRLALLAFGAGLAIAAIYLVRGYLKEKRPSPSFQQVIAIIVVIFSFISLLGFGVALFGVLISFS